MGTPTFDITLELHPPVHIVVERGHVTLNGVVNSEDGQSAGTRADRPAGRVLDYQ